LSTQCAVDPVLLSVLKFKTSSVDSWSTRWYPANGARGRSSLTLKWVGSPKYHAKGKEHRAAAARIRVWGSRGGSANLIVGADWTSPSTQTNDTSLVSVSAECYLAEALEARPTSRAG